MNSATNGTVAQDDMSADHSPEQGQGGGRRVNGRPMQIAGAVLLGFVAIMAMVMFDRSQQQNQLPAPPTKAVESSDKMAESILAQAGNGLVPEKNLPAEKAPADDGQASTLPTTMPHDLPPPQPNRFSGFGRTAMPPLLDEEAERIRAFKMQRFQEAVQAKTAVSVDVHASASSSSFSGSSTGSAPQTREEMLARLSAMRGQLEQRRQNDPTVAYQQRMAALKASGLLPDSGEAGGSIGGMGGMGGAPVPPSAANEREGYAAFDQQGKGDRWQLDTQPQAPRSPYELRAGFILPATLISGVNSDLPGQLMAQVSQNVYDTATGRHLLVPQGTRLIGSYESDVLYGQERVLIAWQRLIFPDGKALDLGAMPGADVAGYAGFNDKVNNHYLRLFGNAFLMSGVTAAVTLSQDRRGAGGSGGNNQRASDALSESLGQVLGNTISQIVSKNLNIAPTLEIRPGFRFNVIVTKDLTFRSAYQSFDYGYAR